MTFRLSSYDTRSFFSPWSEKKPSHGGEGLLPKIRGEVGASQKAALCGVNLREEANTALSLGSARGQAAAAPGLSRTRQAPGTSGRSADAACYATPPAPPPEAPPPAALCLMPTAPDSQAFPTGKDPEGAPAHLDERLVFQLPHILCRGFAARNDQTRVTGIPGHPAFCSP